MQLSWLRAAMLGLCALAGTTSAVSLASFIPRIDNLPSQCASVYNSQIDGCQAGDFGDQAICSNACIQGLNKITQEVSRSCADVDVGETSIIGVFQRSLGIASLCPNTPVTIVTPSSSATKTTVQTSTQAAASTTQAVATTSTSTSISAAQSSSTSSARIVIDPSATATSSVDTPQLNTASSSSKTNPTQVANSQLSNADSGGGSPFDVVATGSSSQLRRVPGSMAALIATAVLFVVCT